MPRFVFPVIFAIMVLMVQDKLLSNPNLSSVDQTSCLVSIIVVSAVLISSNLMDIWKTLKNKDE